MLDMGRITIFSIADCPYCTLVENALKERNIPYTEISLTTYPQKRDELYHLVQRRSIPQVFFNTRHVGGADDTLELLKEWDINPRYKSPRERYDMEIGRWPDPQSATLSIPASSPPSPTSVTIPTLGLARNKLNEELMNIPRPQVAMKMERTSSIVLPTGNETVTTVEITELLKEILPISDLKYGISMYRNCFKGNDAVMMFQEHFGISKEQAVAFGKKLLEADVLHHVLHDHDFLNSHKVYYRLHCHQTPDVLNSYRVWNSSSNVDSEQLLSHLEGLLSRVESDMTSSTANATIDYKNACKHEKYVEFEETVCGLQSVNLHKFNSTEMLVFGMNLYKVMLKYSFMKVGIGTTELSRLAQLQSVKFHVGGYIFSLHDWYNGILRGNRRALNNISVPFGKKDSWRELSLLAVPFGKRDPRRELSLSDVDYRIHFALNNINSRSCTPIKKFTVDDIDNELDIVANVFCENDNNISVNAKTGEVHLCEMFRWYHQDFTNTTPTSSTAMSIDENYIDLLSVIVNFMHGTKQFELKRLLSRTRNSVNYEDKKIIKVSFNSGGCWSLNAGEFVPFERKSLAAREKGLRNLIKKSW